jgi:hypothetical protein
MLEKIGTFASEISQSSDFDSFHKRGEPVDDESIKRLVEVLKMLGHEVPSALVKFYETCDGFTLRWTYKKSTHPDYITSGDTDISKINLLLTWLQHVPTEPIPFDHVSDINQVLLQVEKQNIALLYRDMNLDETFPMSIDVNQYFRLLDESRGLYPWRELFVESSSFRLEPVLKEKFFADLSLLFEDTDPTLFSQSEV